MEFSSRTVSNALVFLYFLLPFILWPLTFIVFSNRFIYAMALSDLLLLVLTIVAFRKYVKLRVGNVGGIVAFGICAAILLYTIFLAGYYLAGYVGMGAYVGDVYSMIYSEGGTLQIVLLLAFIGVAEETYWRGGIQGYAFEKMKRFKARPWLLSTLYYGGIHLTTMNPILAIAALLVGLVTSLVAYRKGILASMISHIFWIEAIVVFLPVLHA